METANLPQEEFPAMRSEHFPFKESRPLQDAAVKLISDSWKNGYKYVFLEAPTGFGKSAIAITLSKENPKAFILVSTKILQNQYVRERAYRTFDVRGRQNFRCMKSRHHTCDIGPCQAGDVCKHQPERASEEIPAGHRILAETPKGVLHIDPTVKLCRYWEQKCAALRHKYPIINYSYFLHETFYAGDFGPRKLLICDEAHNIEDSLMKFVEFSVSDKDLEHVGSKVPEGELPIAEWIGKIREWEDLMRTERAFTKDRIEKIYNMEKRAELAGKLQELEEKVNNCGFIISELQSDPQNWVIDNSVTGRFRKVSFKPIFVRRWANKFFNMADRFLLQSATIIDAEAMAESLDMPKDECIFIRVPSGFKAERRPVYYKPLGRMSKEHIENNLPKLVDAIKALMEEYPDEKGVIHTHSYKIKEYIMANISSERLIANDNSSRTNWTMKTFIESSDPLILVTPSAYERMDFKYDICRWQVLCKMPYPDMADKQVRRRMELDPKWYQWRTVLRLVQTYGRGMRAEDDWCHTYIFDESFAQLMNRNRDMFPGWFVEALKTG